MKGRILLLDIMPQLSILQQNRVLGERTPVRIKELIGKYSKAESLSYDDVAMDLLGLDVAEGKEPLFSMVLENINSLKTKSEEKGGIKNEF